MKKSTAALAVVVISATVLGCGGQQSPAETPAEAPPAAEPVPGPTENATRPELTPEACAANGGVVVGDIGDGAIHRPEYRCPSGAAPSGTIRPPEGGPVAIEGSVCCPK